jgi:hypothetical protein
MPYPRISRAILLLTLGLGLCGCATMTPSLYIPPSDSTNRAFAPPPPAIIRLPVSVSVPRLVSLSQNFTQWIDQEIHKISEDAQKPAGFAIMKSPLAGMSNLWDGMQEPIYIDKNIWLLIRPETLSTGLTEPVKSNPFTWKVVLEMAAHPILIFGNKPLVEKKLLPPMSAYKPGPTGFHAVSNIGISFKEANRILADPKDGLTNYPIRGSGSYHLRVKGVRLYGSGGQVIAETKIQFNPPINFSGKPSLMTIYFRGTPEYDPTKELFYLKRLDFDVKTGDFITEVASWIFKSDILNALRKKAHIPIGTELDKLKERMNIVLNCQVGKHSRLVTHVDSFRVLEAHVNHDGIQAQISLDGTAQLHLFSHP